MKPVWELDQVKAYEKRKKELARRVEWRSKLSRLVPAVLVATVLWLLFLYVWLSPIGARTELAQLELFYWLRGERQVPQNVVLVGLDDLTYSKLQKAGMLDAGPRMGMPRRHTAEALYWLQKEKPKALFVDAYIAPEKLDPKADQRMEEALALGPAVIGTYHVYGDKKEDAEIRPEDLAVEFESDERFQTVAHAQVPYVFSVDFDQPPFPRPPVRLNGCFRSVPQKANS